MKSIITIIALLAVTITVQAQSSNRAIDSLQHLLETAKADTDKINTAISISIEYRADGDHKNAIKYAELALNKSKSANYKTGICNAYNAIGIVHIIKADYQSALNNFSLALGVCKVTGNKKMIAKLYNNMGIAYDRMNDYDNQIKCYVNSLKASEEINDTISMATIYQNIGGVYMKGGDNDKALKYFQEALRLCQEIKSKDGEGNSYVSIASVYKDKGNYNEALSTATKSLVINKETGDKWQIVSSLSCLASIYFQTKDYDKAINNYTEALNLSKEISDESGMSNFYMEIGKTYLKKNNLNEAHKNLTLAIEFSQKTSDKETLTQSYKLMSELFNKQNDCRKSYDYYLKYSALKDSTNNYETVIKIESLQAKYESDKKEKIMALEQQAKDEKQKAKFEKERIIKYSFMAGFILILGITFFIFKGYRDKVKSNKIISEQKKIVEEKNKEMTDATMYASRIQRAIFAPEDFINDIMPENFIFFSPKDSIGGDFYFVDKVDDKILWASCDSTGHSSNGSLLSMLGVNILSGIVKDGETTPSKILDKLNQRLNESLHKTNDDSIRDGMDVSFCSLNKDTLILNYAGANNPLWIVRGSDILEYKADKLAIGQMYKNANYTNHEIQLQAGDTIYSFSDGYCDQFGSDGKKFMKKRFRELLLSIRDKSMTEQKAVISETINQYKFGVEQTDDLLVFGVRV